MPTIVNPTLPVILTNGTATDATQVMSDLNYIVAQINANGAENGANSSITSLNGLTTPLSVPQGGTGVAGLTQYNVLMGAGTSQIAVIAPGAAGTILASNGATAYATFQAASSVVNAAVIEASLGFTPVQQGTGFNQGTNAIKLGWYTGTGNGLALTVDNTNNGYIVLSSNPPGVGYNVVPPFNGAAGLFDNGNRVWSPGNYQPLQDNGIGFDIVFSSTTSVEGNTYTLAGRPGTWICLSTAVFNTNQQFYRRVT